MTLVWQCQGHYPRLSRPLSTSSRRRFRFQFRWCFGLNLCCCLLSQRCKPTYQLLFTQCMRLLLCLLCSLWICYSQKNTRDGAGVAQERAQREEQVSITSNKLVERSGTSRTARTFQGVHCTRSPPLKIDIARQCEEKDCRTKKRTSVNSVSHADISFRSNRMVLRLLSPYKLLQIQSLWAVWMVVVGHSGVSALLTAGGQRCHGDRLPRDAGPSHRRKPKTGWDGPQSGLQDKGSGKGFVKGAQAPSTHNLPQPPQMGAMPKAPKNEGIESQGHAAPSTSDALLQALLPHLQTESLPTAIQDQLGSFRTANINVEGKQLHALVAQQGQAKREITKPTIPKRESTRTNGRSM